MNLKIRITDQNGNVLSNRESYIDINKKVSTKTHKDVHDFGIVVKRGDKVISNNKPQKRNNRQDVKTNNKAFKKNNKQKPQSIFDRINKNEKYVSQIKEEKIIQDKVNVDTKPIERTEVTFNNEELNKTIGPSKLTEKDILEFLNNTKDQVKPTKKETIKEVIEDDKEIKPEDKAIDNVDNKNHQKSLAEKRNKYMMLYKSKEKILKQKKEENEYKYDDYSEYDNAPKYEKMVNRKGGEF